MTFKDWEAIDKHELDEGLKSKRIRTKITSYDEIKTILGRK